MPALVYKKSDDKKTITITLNQPDKYNAMSNDDYLLLGKMIEQADQDPDSTITAIQSTGKYFSSGANVSDPKLSQGEGSVGELDYWLSKFLARNLWLTSLFMNHSKVIVSCLNGPVIGLSAALVAMSDLCYAMNDKVFLLVPFGNLGLVCEGATSTSLVMRLGLSKANEAVLLSKPMSARELADAGFINQLYDMQDVNEFNSHIVDELSFRLKDLARQSVLDNKKLLRQSFIKQLESSNAQEAVQGLQKFIQGIPQKRFREMATRQRRHKL